MKYIRTYEQEIKKTYVICKNSGEDNYDLHNGKSYEVIKYDDQPYGIGNVKVLMPDGNEKTYPKTMFGNPYIK